MSKLNRGKHIIFVLFIFFISETTQCQNSLIGDGFGGRQWYLSHNYQVGAYTAYTVCSDSNQLYAWGNNMWGELGINSILSSDTPVAVTGMTNVKFYSTGYVSGVIKNDNTAWVWGGISNGFYTTPPSGFSNIPVMKLSNVKFIDGGLSHIAFVKNDGTVWAAGRNDVGELGNGSASVTPVTNPVQILGINNAVRAIAAGGGSDFNGATVILLNDGTVKITGGGGWFQANSRFNPLTYTPTIISGLTNIVDIKANNAAIYALDSFGNVYSFGIDPCYSRGSLGFFNSCGNRMPPTLIQFPAGSKPIIALSANNDGRSALALDSSKNVYAWGNNSYGQLGDGTIINILTPQLVASNVIDIFSGETFSYILKSDSNLYASGKSGYDFNVNNYNYGSIWMNQSNMQRNNFTLITPPIYSLKLCIPKPFGCTAPLIRLGNDTSLCPGSQIVLTAPTFSSYLWSTGATSQSIIVSNAGQYWVKIGSGQCSSSDTINVNYSLPQVTFGNDTTLCPSGQLILTAPTFSSYLWSTGATSQSITISTSGQYWVKIGNSVCFSSDTINVTFSLPQISLGIDTTLCQGKTLMLSAGVASNYLWSTGAITQTISVNSGGQYWVRASNANCFNTDTINVAFAPQPNVTLGADTILCENQILPLSAGIASNYLWSSGATTQSINVTTSGQYWVRASNSTCVKTDSIVISFKLPPSFLFPVDTLICNNQVLKLNAGKAEKYLWSTGDTTQIINVIKNGNYSVTINFYNTCQKTFSTNVNFDECDCILLMPNAFTPNSDGLNDLFKPAKKTGCQFLTFSIFNRYGENVFETSDLNQGWNGKIKGQIQQSGVFVWQVTALKDGKYKLFKGTFTLIR